MARLEPVVTGLTFPEGPRWREGRLFFSDFYSHAVYAVGIDGRLETVVQLADQPSGLGWLPGGDLLIVSMADWKVLRWNGVQLSVHADLGSVARDKCNDMIVLANGRAYVGGFGFDPYVEDPRTTDLIRVDPNGTVGIAASDLAFPNGMAVLEGENTLVVAESTGECLTAFDIARDGSLSNRRVFARTPGCQPDGICTDAQGDLLVTTMTCDKLIRFAADGGHRQTLTFDTHLWACAVSDDGEILVCTSRHFVPDQCRRERSGAIQRVVFDAGEEMR